MSVPVSKQAASAAVAATNWALGPPPSSRAIKPVKSNETALASAAKNRNPASEVPNNVSESLPKNGVTGGYATYPHARCRESLSVASSSRWKPYCDPVNQCTTTVAAAINITSLEK